MAAFPLTENALHKAEMEFHGKFGHTIERIQYIDIMSRIEILCNLMNGYQQESL